MQMLTERLRTDFGRKTLGELIQEREAAAFEIERLTQELGRFRSSQAPKVKSATSMAATPSPSLRIEPRAESNRSELLRLKEVCQIVGLARSTIYLAITKGSFPRPVQVGARAVRWRSSDISGWVASKRPQGAIR